MPSPKNTENTYSRKHRCQKAKETLKKGDAERHYPEERDVGSDEDGDNCPFLPAR